MRRDEYFIPETAGTGASPGYSFGRSGNTSAGNYLLNEAVPSNLTGRPVGLSDCSIIGIVVSNENINTFQVEIEEHDGVTYTSLGIYTITASRSSSFLNLSVPVTSGKELAVKISSGSCKNVVVTIYVKGNAI